jgi:hypothetical protein
MGFTHLQSVRTPWIGGYRPQIHVLSALCPQLNVLNPPSETGSSCRYRDWLRAGRFGDRIPVWARFSVPVQTVPGAHPASCTMGTGSFQGVESGRGVTLTTHLLLVSRCKTRVAIPLLSLRAFVACKKLNSTYPLPEQNSWLLHCHFATSL